MAAALGLIAAAALPAHAENWSYKGTLGFSLVASRAGETGQTAWSSDLDLQLVKPTSYRDTVWIYLQDDYGKVRERETDTEVVSPDQVDYQAKYLREVSKRQLYFVSYSVVGTHNYSEADNAIGAGLRFPVSPYLDVDVSEEKVLGDVWQHKVQIYFARTLGPRLKATGNGSAAGSSQFGSSADGGLTYQLTNALAVRLNATFAKRRGEASWSRTVRFQAVWAVAG
jgi:hypothetical protein